MTAQVVVRGERSIVGRVYRMTNLRLYQLLPVIGLALVPAFAGEPLPEGDRPEPVAVPHFPDRLHAVIWRNWGLVEPARLARVLGATGEQIRARAVSMGLPAEVRVPPEWRRRGYITLVRQARQLQTALRIRALRRTGCGHPPPGG
jgi:hypothetical protein